MTFTGWSFVVFLMLAGIGALMLLFLFGVFIPFLFWAILESARRPELPDKKISALKQKWGQKVPEER